MKNTLKIDNVSFISADPRDLENGLLGWIRCRLNHSIHLDGLCLRRTEEGNLTISYPGRKDSAGKIHHHLKPADNVTRREMERQIFTELKLIGKVSQ